jgi:transposase
MPAPLSLDIRNRVIMQVEDGSSRREASDRFDISASAAIKWVQRWKATGSAEPKPSGGSLSPLDEHKEQILAIFRETPDMTLAEAAAAVGRRVIKTSRSAIHRFCERHEVTFKKNTTRGRTKAARRGRGKATLDPSPRST